MWICMLTVTTLQFSGLCAPDVCIPLGSRLLAPEICKNLIERGRNSRGLTPSADFKNHLCLRQLLWLLRQLEKLAIRL